jgi:sugar phosphate isomerase/epimerase
MRLRLGINTCFAAKRWPRPVDWAPIVREQLGLRLVQHSLDLVDLGAFEAGRTAEVAAIRTACAQHTLELHSTFTGLAAYSGNLLLHPEPAARVAGRQWLEAAIRFTAELGGVAAGGHVGAFSVADWRDGERRRVLWEELQTTLTGLAAGARTAGLDYLVVENLAAAREPSTMAMIRDLLTSGDRGHVPIRLCLDVGHMCVPGTSGADRDPYDWLRELGREAPMVQLQQSDTIGDHHWPFTAEWNALGRIDADLTIDALGDAGVETADLFLEVIPPFEQDDGRVVDDLVASVAYWREALVRRGADAD